MRCPDCNAVATHTGAGGEASWTGFACGNAAENVHGTVTFTDTCERAIVPGSPTQREEPMSTTPSNTQVVELDFTAFIAKLQQPGEWGPMSAPPKSIEEYVAGEAVSGLEYTARTAVERAVDKLVGDLQSTIEQTVRELIEKRIDERFKRPFQPMKFGEKVGDPVSMLDLIDHQIEAACKVREWRDGRPPYGEKTVVEKVIENHVNYRLTDDMRKAAESAKELVTKAMQQEGAKIIAENVSRLSQGLAAKQR